VGLIADMRSQGQQQYNESETLTKFEVMDGVPVRGGLS
jgi:hypothetical protein